MYLRASKLVYLLTNYELKVTINHINMQSAFTALQGVILNLRRDLKNLKQEFDQTKIFKLNKYIIKMAY